jgi:hypothetical protein
MDESSEKEPNKPTGFVWSVKKSGDVEIFHHGILATVLRGEAANKAVNSLNAATPEEQQEILARVTGNYKRGNERQAKNHPRNR